MEKLYIIAICMSLAISTMVFVYRFCLGKQKKCDLQYNNWHMQQQRKRESNMSSFLNEK